jgi:hypothetical protein
MGGRLPASKLSSKWSAFVHRAVEPHGPYYKNHVHDSLCFVGNWSSPYYKPMDPGLKPPYRYLLLLLYLNKICTNIIQF